MCVRVIMRVVSCRLDCKQFVLRYCSVPKLTVHAAVLCRTVLNVCNKTVLDKLNHVIVCKYCTTSAFHICCIIIEYLVVLSWINAVNMSV